MLNEDKTALTPIKQNLKQSFESFYLKTKNYINGIQRGEINIYDAVVIQNMATDLAQGRDKFLEDKEIYLRGQREKLRVILFENLSVEEIRKMYR